MDYLIDIRTGLGLAMAFEKVKTKKDIDYIINRLKEKKRVNKREKKTMRLVVKNIEKIMQS